MGGFLCYFRSFSDRLAWNCALSGHKNTPAMFGGGCCFTIGVFSLDLLCSPLLERQTRGRKISERSFPRPSFERLFPSECGLETVTYSAIFAARLHDPKVTALLYAGFSHRFRSFLILSSSARSQEEAMTDKTPFFVSVSV